MIIPIVDIGGIHCLDFLFKNVYQTKQIPKG